MIINKNKFKEVAKGVSQRTWDKMMDIERKAYLEENPTSKYANKTLPTTMTDPNVNPYKDIDIYEFDNQYNDNKYKVNHTKKYKPDYDIYYLGWDKKYNDQQFKDFLSSYGERSYSDIDLTAFTKTLLDMGIIKKEPKDMKISSFLNRKDKSLLKGNDIGDISFRTIEGLYYDMASRYDIVNPEAQKEVLKKLGELNDIPYEDMVKGFREKESLNTLKDRLKYKNNTVSDLEIEIKRDCVNALYDKIDEKDAEITALRKKFEQELESLQNERADLVSCKNSAKNDLYAMSEKENPEYYKDKFDLFNRDNKNIRRFVSSLQSHFCYTKGILNQSNDEILRDKYIKDDVETGKIDRGDAIELVEMMKKAYKETKMDDEPDSEGLYYGRIIYNPDWEWLERIR